MFGNHNQLHVSFQILFPGIAYQVREYGAVNIGGLLCVFVLCFVYEYFTWTYICALTVCLMLIEVKRRYQIPWNWRCRSLWATIRVLGTSAWFSKRTTSEPNLWDIFLAPEILFKRKTIIQTILAVRLGKNHLIGKVKWFLWLLATQKNTALDQKSSSLQ